MEHGSDYCHHLGSGWGGFDRTRRTPPPLAMGTRCPWLLETLIIGSHRRRIELCRSDVFEWPLTRISRSQHFWCRISPKGTYTNRKPSNCTMFDDLNWPLHASRGLGLSASAAASCRRMLGPSNTNRGWSTYYHLCLQIIVFGWLKSKIFLEENIKLEGFDAILICHQLWTSLLSVYLRTIFQVCLIASVYELVSELISSVDLLVAFS